MWLLPRSTDVLTFTGSYRRDDYQIPRDPGEEVLFENLQIERDAFVNGLWTHSTSGPGVWSVAPYYHFNRVALNPEGLVDLGASIDDRRIHDVGAKVDWSWSAASHQVRIGTNAYGSFLHDVFSLPVGEEGVAVADHVSQSGLNAGIYVQDRFQPTREITIDAGLRWDTTHAYQTESLLQPRAGITARIPNSGFTAHGYAGRLFQVPPLEAVGLAGSEAAAAADQAFLTVRAERDTVWEAGLTWSRRQVNIDVMYCENHASNFLDHEQLGDSAVFFPVNIEHARLRGAEFSVSTPPEHPLRARLVYSHAYAEARGAITGGLGDIDAPAEEGYFYLDHDQRDTASASLDWAPHGGRDWAHARVQYRIGLPRRRRARPPAVAHDRRCSAGVTLSRHVEAAVDIQNIANNVFARRGLPCWKGADDQPPPIPRGSCRLGCHARRGRRGECTALLARFGSSSRSHARLARRARLALSPCVQPGGPHESARAGPAPATAAGGTAPACRAPAVQRRGVRPRPAGALPRAAAPLRVRVLPLVRHAAVAALEPMEPPSAVRPRGDVGARARPVRFARSESPRTPRALDRRERRGGHQHQLVGPGQLRGSAPYRS